MFFSPVALKLMPLMNALAGQVIGLKKIFQYKIEIH